MVRYPFPPSKHILKYGPIDMGSHYVCDGKVWFKGWVARCRFEVAYTGDCRTIVLLYLGPDQSYRAFSPGSAIRENSEVPLIAGHDCRTGKLVVIYDCHLQTTGQLFNSNEDEWVPAAFVGHRLVIRQRKTTTKDVASVFGVIGVTLEEARTAKISFHTENENLRKIELRRTVPRAAEFANETVSFLHIPAECTSEAWPASSLADLWVSAASLALGKTITWCYQGFEPLDCVEWKLRTSVFAEERVAGLISDRWAMDPSRELVPFISEFMIAAMNSGLRAVDTTELEMMIRSHIAHRVRITRDIDQLRLLTTSVEELLNWITDRTGNSPTSPMKESDKGAVISALTDWLRENIDNILPPEISNSKTRQHVKQKLPYLARNGLDSISLEDRLRYLLEHSCMREWYENWGNVCVREFALLRNTVAHSGKYPYEDPSLRYWLIQNAVMIFARTLFAAIGFRGLYRDFVLDLANPLPKFPTPTRRT